MRELHVQATVVSRMAFAPALRRFTFTTHVTTSVGWIGAVLVFLALALIGLTSQDERTVRGAYLVMAPAAWFVLVPLAPCSACAANVEQTALKLDGVTAAKVSQPKGTAEITYDSAKTNPTAIAEYITDKSGFKAEVVGSKK